MIFSILMVTNITVTDPTKIQNEVTNKNFVVCDTPTAKKKPYSVEIHDTKIEDEYHWLRDENWPKEIINKDILSYLDEENIYFDKFMAPLANQKKIIFEEIMGRIKKDFHSAYIQKGDYYYYKRWQENDNYPIFCRKHHSIQGKEEIILDINKLAKGKKFTSLGSYSINPNQNFVAYSVDFTGNERFTIKIFDLKKKKYLTDEIINCEGQIVWHENGEGFFYKKLGESSFGNKIMFHKLETKSSEDILVYQTEANSSYLLRVLQSSSKKYIIINRFCPENNEIYLIPMNDKTFTPIIVKEKTPQVHYFVDHGADYFYMHTNADAKNGKTLKTQSLNQPWQEYVPEDSNKDLINFDLTEKYIILNYKENGVPVIIIKDLANHTTKKINFPDDHILAMDTAQILSKMIYA